MPDQTRQKQIKNLLLGALEQSAETREAFVSAAALDSAMRAEVLKLIDDHERAGGFLNGSNTPEPNGETSAPRQPGDLPGVVIDRYELVSLIGEGGFGSVFLAQQRTPVQREVALKIIKLGMDTRQVVARFESERQTLAMMEHPGIARVIDGGATESGRPYFVMELVRGVPITVYCDKHRLAIAQRLDLFVEVCSAVQHAHTKGVIHRDLKPSNVLVTEHDGLALPKVIDFGIAKATGLRITEQTLITEVKQLIGTPEYMSPEQADVNATDIDTRSDVYSLGVLLYELLTGTTPFDGSRLRSSTFAELLRIIREEEPLRPSTSVSRLASVAEIAHQRRCEPRRLATQLLGDLDWIALKALEKDRERRYRSANELADDLQRHLKHEPVLARPPAATYRLRKFIRRHRMGVAAATLVALAVICGGIGTTAAMLRARDADDQAHQINQFMREILTSVDPDYGKGADLRLVEVLVNAAATASQRFAEHPELEAQIHGLLGAVYAKLALLPQATAEYKAAWERWQLAVGPDDPQTLSAEVGFVLSLGNEGRQREVEAAIVGLAPRVEQVLGTNHPAWFEVQRMHALRMAARGEMVQADEFLSNLLNRARNSAVDESIQIKILWTLARILARRLDVVQEANSELIRQRCEAVASELFDGSSRRLGPDAPMTLEAQVILAISAWYGGDNARAAELSRAVLDVSRDRLGQCHMIRQRAMEFLGNAILRLGDAPQSADLYLQILQCQRQVPPHPVVIVGKLFDALPFLDRGGRWIEGEQVARELVVQLQQLGGGHDQMLLDAELAVARFVDLQGRWDEAESLFGALLPRENEARENQRTFARMHLYYGAHLAKRDMYEEAQDHLQVSASAISDIRKGTCKTVPDDIIVEFIALYRAWGRPEKAAEFEQLQAESLQGRVVQ